MKSLYLNQEIDLLKTRESEDGIFYTSHEELEKALIKPSLNEQHIVYNYEFVQVATDHSVVVCTISDKNNRRIQQIGEGLSCKSCFTTTEAAKKAFDKAVITYFNFEGVVAPDYLFDERKGAEEDDAQGTKNDSKNACISEENVDIVESEPIINNNHPAAIIKIEEDVEDVAGAEVVSASVQVTTEESIEEKIESVKTDELEDIGDMIITIGKYKQAESKKTIKEIFEENNGWFMYICDKFVTAKDAELLKQADAMREYAKKHK